MGNLGECKIVVNNKQEAQKILNRWRSKYHLHIVGFQVVSYSEKNPQNNVINNWDEYHILVERYLREKEA